MHCDFWFSCQIYRCKVDQWWLIMWLITKIIIYASVYSAQFSVSNFSTIYFDCRFSSTVTNDMILFIVRWPFESKTYWNFKYYLFTSDASRFWWKFLICWNLFSFQFWNSKKFLFESKKGFRRVEDIHKLTCGAYLNITFCPICLLKNNGCMLYRISLYLIEFLESTFYSLRASNF